MVTRILTVLCAIVPCSIAMGGGFNSGSDDVKFDLDAMTNFDGETGPYVQYAVARLSSILRKADYADDDLTGVDFSQLADAEQVLLAMLDFGPSLDLAAAKSEPSIITNLMIQVASRIHSYLRDHHVLRAAPELRKARLALVAATRKVLKTGLALIGVAAPEQM